MSDDATINVEADDSREQFTRTSFELLISDGKGCTGFPICFGEVVLGSAGDRPVDICLESRELANRQAVFHYRGNALFFTNLEPRLKFAVNGVPATFSPLKDGDQISFLHYTIGVLDLDEKLAILEGCSEPHRGQVWGVDKEPVTIGRGSGVRSNVVDLADRTISRAQATILSKNGEFFLQPDTNNSPIRIDGQPVQTTERLPNGALLQLGQQLLRFRISEVEKARRELISQEATILFSDVWNYSTFAEGRPLEEVIGQMNEFYSGLGKVIKTHGGVLLTFLGDAMMAVFGADGPAEEAPRQAVLAALGMQQRLEELNAEWNQQSRPRLQAGIGINSGEVMVGDVGFTGKYEFAAMGDQTNLAARVEKLTREFGVSIIVTGSTRSALGQEFALKELGVTTVKGREAEVELFAVIGVA